MLVPQENDDLLSSGSAATDALQAFKFDNVTTTLSALHNSPVETPSSESLASSSPMPSFYATTPSPITAVELCPLRLGVSRVCLPVALRMWLGGSWKVPLVVTWLASESPIP
ncbi:hypothetical protein EDB83DRAFT_2527280 [Lactarius deliciosus]|nr:hypothetical protein EDB83DRAFT_2527280 [Lactarius deliciosus]